MDLLLQEPFTYLDAFLLVFVRMISFFIAVPLFGIRNIPRTTKIAIAFFTAAIMISIQPMTLDVSSAQIIPYAILVVKEFIVGWIIGFGAYLAFSIITLAGQLIDYQIGFTMVNVFDPLSQVQITITGNLYYYLLLLMMLATNTHYILIKGLVNSFEWIPIGTSTFKIGLYTEIINFFGDFFIIALQIAAPMIGSMLIINVVLGILARATPQMNMFVVGLPLKLMVGLVVLLITLAVFPHVSDWIFERMLKLVDTIVKGMSSL
ncbi:flagellar type III secretion system protein FliR [Vallitalea pronyensis]|uniref:Flagellar biosynthetic protein FliR n=1 Tax=Vallitalea pronyensis TaxID=1348613 RepID=A0A8J8MKS7_9FIRM|nr:flagellar biosynthetic protein FliR [Vallitalea pronyensis]QUI23242.1 flagellar type III secretion system protein FliR [Vallitalea pronyensis]